MFKILNEITQFNEFNKIKIILIFITRKMEEKINMILLGNSSVGKTSFILRYTESFFQPIYLTTIGIDFKVKEVELNNKKKYKLFFYDTTGQEKYRSIAVNLIKNADGVFLMYDITSKKSFDSISEWMESIFNSKPKNFPIVLIGNKLDLEDCREVDSKEGEELAKSYEIPFFEISNKEGTKVEECCLSLANKIVEQKEEEAKRKIEQNANNIKVEKNSQLHHRKEKRKKFC